MKNYYCEQCGNKYQSVVSLAATRCLKHPDGRDKGRCKLYEGTEKDFYICKYCGNKFNTILNMKGSSCWRHPKGKGFHDPAL